MNFTFMNINVICGELQNASLDLAELSLASSQYDSQTSQIISPSSCLKLLRQYLILEKARCKLNVIVQS